MKYNALTVMLRLIRLVKPLTFYMIIAILFGVLGYLCAMAIPVVSAMVLFQHIGMYIHIPFQYAFAILIVAAIMRGIFHYIEQACNHYIAFKILAIIRDHVYKALRRLAPAKLDGKDKGNLISMITSDIELLEVFYAHTISPICIAFIITLILLKFFMHLHFYAFIIALISYITMAIIIPFTIYAVGKKIGERNRNKIGDLSRFFLESYRGLLTLSLYDASHHRLNQMNEKSDEIEQLQKQLKIIESYQIMLSQILITLSSLIMFVVMYRMYINNEISLYKMILSVILLISSYGPTLALSSLANNLISTLNCGKRVISLLDEQELIKDVSGKKEVLFNDISLKDIEFSYDEEVILKDMNIDIYAKERIGIVGKSGSGKSTLLKLIMRFYDPSLGMIKINDTQLSAINTKDLRSMFAYVTQDTVLFHDSIMNNIKIARLNASEYDVIEACKKANIHDFIMSLPEGYQTTVAELGDSLSSGQKQRISLARAFLSDAPCFLLDEPTSQLDVLNEALLLKSLKECKDKTIVLVTHRKSTLKDVDKIKHVKQGRLS